MATDGSKSFIINQSKYIITVMTTPITKISTSHPTSMRNGETEPLTMTMKGVVTAIQTSTFIGSTQTPSNAPARCPEDFGGIWSWMSHLITIAKQLMQMTTLLTSMHHHPMTIPCANPLLFVFTNPY